MNETKRNAGSGRPKRRAVERADAIIHEQIVEELEEEKEIIDQRTKRLKEKNKRAQQRFRERQKEKNTATQHRVEELEAQVEQLQARLALAQDRVQLLERILSAPAARPIIFEPYRVGFKALPEREFAMVLRGFTPGRIVQVTRETVLSISFDEHVAVFREYVGLTEAELKRLRADPQAQAAPPAHLMGIMTELFAWCSWLNRIEPHVMARMQRTRLDTGAPAVPAERPPAAHLLRILQAAGLTDEQAAQLVSARRYCLSTLASLQRERRSVIAALQEVAGGGSSWEELQVAHASLAEQNQRLSGVVAGESTAFSTFMSAALLKVLTPMQMAIVLVSAYPYMPRVMGLTAVLAGEPEDGAVDLARVPPSPLGDPAAAFASLDEFSDDLWAQVLTIG